MTNCLRSLSFHLNLHPKFVAFGSVKSVQAVQRGGHTYAGNSNPQRSTFLYEFLDGRQGGSSSVSETSKCLMTPPIAALTPLPDYYLYDPILHQLVVKPLSVTTDDIVLRSSSSSSASVTCDQLLEQDLQRDVIQGRFPVTVLMETLPASLASQIATFHQSCLPLTELEKDMILTADASPTNKKPTQSQSQMEEKPSDEQLSRIYNVLSERLPNFFVKPQDYRIFHQNLVFQNNIRGITTHGLPAYIQQMALLRLIGHLKFAYVKMEVLKMTKHPEDGTIRVRWRIRGVSGLRIFLQFWKYRVWQYKKMMERESDWYDGFSTFYVASDGLVHKHVCDKMMPDEDKVKQPSRTNLAAKLAFLLGAIPRPSMEDLAAVSLALVQLQHQHPTNTNKNDLL